jgi:hypothetical protein
MTRTLDERDFPAPRNPTPQPNAAHVAKTVTGILKLLADPRDWVAENGRGALGCALRLARYARGDALASHIEGPPGFYSISSSEREFLMRSIPNAMKSSLIARHEWAPERLEIALGSYMLDEAPTLH